MEKMIIELNSDNRQKIERGARTTCSVVVLIGSSTPGRKDRLTPLWPPKTGSTKMKGC